MANLTWTSRPNLSTARGQGLARGDTSGRLLVYGGGTSYSVSVGTLERFDPAANSWTTLTAGPSRREATGCFYNGKLYAFAGHADSDGAPLNTTSIYDPGANSWSSGAAMPAARTYVSGDVIGTKFYVTGGYISGAEQASTYAYDFAANSWTTKAPMNTARFGHAAAAVNGKLYAFGGRKNDGSAVTSAEVYDPNANTWTTLPAAMPAIIGGGDWIWCTAVSAYGLIYLLSRDAPGTASRVVQYNPASDTYLDLGPLPANVGESALGVTGDGYIYSAGGITNNGGSLTAAVYSAPLNHAPNAPTLTSPATGATIDRVITQRFAWTFSDPDTGDSQSAFDLQYRIVGGPTWTTVSGTTPNQFYDFAAATFAAGNYEWQVRTYDSAGSVGPWSSSSFFTAASAPPAPTITAPVNGSTVVQNTAVTWSTPNQSDYQVRRVADNAGAADTSTVYSDTGDVVDGITRSLPLVFDTNNRWEHIQVRIKNAGLWSTWADARVQVSYTLPTVATFTMTPDPTTATRTLTITNPAPGGGVPATAYNDVYCRTAASSTVLDTYRPYSATGTRIGTALATNTTWVDRTPAGDPVVYEYRVVSVATNQTTSDSGWQATG